MTYSELLQQREWIEKSASIIQRDSFKCQKCGSIGFRSMSFHICKDLVEIDRLFDGWKFNGLTFSEYIDKEMKSYPKYEKLYVKNFVNVHSYSVRSENI